MDALVSAIRSRSVEALRAAIASSPAAARAPRAIVEAGGDVERADALGRTPVDIARARGRPQVLALCPRGLTR